MDDKRLIKEKMKEGKKKVKDDNKSILGFIIAAILQAISTLIIPIDTKFMPAVLLCYLALTSFIYVKIYSAYKIIKHTRKKSYILSTNEARSYEKGFKTFIYLSLIATIVIIFIRKLSIWTILAPILNLFYFNEVLTDDLPPDYGIRETFSYLDLELV